MVNKKALETVTSVPIEGEYYRYIRTRYAAEPLSMLGALRNGGRYNVAGEFGALYLGFNRATCEAEVSQGILAGLPTKPGSFTVWNYDVFLASIIRLDNPDILSALEITETEITIPGNHWTATQIGRPLFDRKMEGLVAPSAQRTGGKCLDIYLDNTKTASRVVPVNQIATWP